MITVSRCIEGVSDVHLRAANPSQSAACTPCPAAFGGDFIRRRFDLSLV
jgi:hypothetical protein